MEEREKELNEGPPAIKKNKNKKNKKKKEIRKAMRNC